MCVFLFNSLYTPVWFVHQLYMRHTQTQKSKLQKAKWDLYAREHTRKKLAWDSNAGETPKALFFLQYHGGCWDTDSSQVEEIEFGIASRHPILTSENSFGSSSSN